MSQKVKLIWVGGEHEFALNIGELRALQSACDAGPEQILMRMVRQEWRIDDVCETIRLGLLGGGFAPA
ncbi:MAG: gene transfer agent family protein, partial [Deltaproteobacteria bacterium]